MTADEPNAILGATSLLDAAIRNVNSAMSELLASGLDKDARHEALSVLMRLHATIMDATIYLRRIDTALTDERKVA